MKTITNKFKIALVAVGLLAIGTANAQTTTGDITQQANATLGSTATAVRLVDHKGTIKYLQSANGLTSLTNTTPNGGVITTWQLGGTLTSNTYITASATGGTGGTPAEFALDGLELVANTGTNASTNAASRDAHDDDPGNGSTGFTVLIRDEDSGAIQKMLLSELLQVQSVGIDEFIQGTATDPNADVNGNATTNVVISVPGLPAITAGTAQEYKLFVFRNGVKLRLGVDFTVALDNLTITYNAADMPMYNGDVIEVQYIR